MEQTERDTLNDYRNRILSVRTDASRRRLAAQFLESVLDLIRILLQKHAGARWREDPKLHACLFAYDGGRNRLVCVASSPFAPLEKVEIEGGKDIIGTAHRNGQPTSFNRPSFQGNPPFIRDLPASIEHLTALPLNLEIVDAYPTAVLAIGSTDENSPIAITGSDLGLRDLILPRILALWLSKYPAIMDMLA